jgi:hypothetical protein
MRVDGNSTGCGGRRLRRWKERVRMDEVKMRR